MRRCYQTQFGNLVDLETEKCTNKSGSDTEAFPFASAVLSIFAFLGGMKHQAYIQQCLVGEAFALHMLAEHRDVRPLLMGLIVLAGLILASGALTPAAHSQTVVTMVHAESNHQGVAYASSRGDVFLTDSGSGTVFVISDAPLSTTTATSNQSTNSTASSTTATTSTPTTIANFLPPELAPYASIIGIVLLFADGLLFGFAIKKAILSAVLILVALVLAGFIGLAIPFLSTSNVWMHLLNILTSQVRIIGPLFYTFPIFWILGLAIGFWKG